MTAKTPEEILTYYADACEKGWARKFEPMETSVPVRVLREAAEYIAILKRERDEAWRRGAEAMREKDRSDLLTLPCACDEQPCGGGKHRQAPEERRTNPCDIFNDAAGELLTFPLPTPEPEGE